MVIFGAEGNLAMKKTFPALYNLFRARHLPSNIVIVGYARDTLTTVQFHKLVHRSIYNIFHPESDRKRFLSCISYQQGQFDDGAAFNELRERLEAFELAQETSWQANQRTQASSGDDFGSSSDEGSGGADGGSGSGAGGGNTSTPPLIASFRHVRTFYMAVPPFVYPSIARCCRAVGLRR